MQISDKLSDKRFICLWALRVGEVHRVAVGILRVIIHAVQHQVDRLRFLNRIGQHRPRIAILAIFIRIAIHIDVAVKCIVGGQVLILGYGSARQILKYQSLELNDIRFFIRGIGKGRSRQQAEQEC